MPFRGKLAAVVVPLVATSPALAGVLGIVFLREPASSARIAGIWLAPCPAPSCSRRAA